MRACSQWNLGFRLAAARSARLIVQSREFGQPSKWFGIQAQPLHLLLKFF
uniref:Uncharacterized protein n=1 Tax=Anguilla anguilla TaxID=7936 RepID=A0A0E9U3S9_ANGAN